MGVIRYMMRNYKSLFQIKIEVLQNDGTSGVNLATMCVLLSISRYYIVKIGFDIHAT